MFSQENYASGPEREVAPNYDCLPGLFLTVLWDFRKTEQQSALFYHLFPE